MKGNIKKMALLLGIIFFTACAGSAQNNAATNNSTTKNNTTMKTYLIERDIPDAGKLTAEQLKGISQKSCSVLKEWDQKLNGCKAM